MIKTCKMCQWCTKRHTPDIPFQPSIVYYECYIKDKIIKHLKINPLYCSWFKMNKKYKEALAIKNEI